MRREVLTLRYDSPEAWLELYEQNFGPIVTAKATLGDRWPEARAEVIELARSTSLAEDGIDGPRVRVSPDDRADGRCVSRASQTSHVMPARSAPDRDGEYSAALTRS